jgi:uncharacterized membrane protein YfcA
MLLLLSLFAFLVSLLTLFTGFGLGTLLMPAFALFLPIEVAVAATAIVHGANNVFKVGLLGRHARRSVVIEFGVPAVLAAFVGAWLLSILSTDTTLFTWSPFGRTAVVTPVKLVLGLLIVAFGFFELLPSLRALRAPAKMLPLGGIIAGFFGGLSGHQGALRAAFLSPLRMPPTEFAATQAVLGLMVDIARLIVYAATFLTAATATEASAPIPWKLVAAASLAAFAGAYLGSRLLPKVTIHGLQVLTGALLLAIGSALAAGVI